MTFDNLFKKAGYNRVGEQYYRHKERPIDIFLDKDTGIDIIDEDQNAVITIRPITLKAIMAHAIGNFWISEEEINDLMEQRNK